LNHWAVKYIGIPWEAGAQGPEAFDCYSFFRHIQRTYFNIDVENVDVDARSIRQTMTAFKNEALYSGWHQVETPRHGDAILMSQQKNPSHIGTWIESGNQSGALHCVYGLGVVFSSMSSLLAAGWGSQSYWRYKWE
jgi:cell wall-associated NlpC family hydrolase